MSTIYRQFPSEPAVIIGTGPSLGEAQVEACRHANVHLFGVNETWRFCPEVHVTVNPEWWDYNMPRETDLAMMCGTTMTAWHSDPAGCERWSLKHFEWFHTDANDSGLSRDPNNVHMGHSSGFAALNIAYLYGCNPIILIGHDMRYPSGYDGRKKIAGGPRHYFGEYPPALQRWPSVKVRDTGELDGLIECYNAVPEKNPDVEIINCSPGSALECFPKLHLITVLMGL